MSSSTSSSEAGPIRLVLRLLPFGAVMLLLMLACWWWGPHISRVDYLAGLGPKHQRLSAIGSPKVVLIGGSNVTFGMDSRMLEQALCKPVVNMTIHASLGFRFMVEELKGTLGPGDLVIAPLEYSAYSKPVQENDVQLLAVDFNPEMLHYMPLWARPKVVLGVGIMRAQAAWKVISGAWKDASPHPVFRADGFNEYGDLVSHFPRPPWELDRQDRVKYHPQAVDPMFWEVLGTLRSEVHAAKAELIFSWPCVAQSSFRPGRADSLRTLLSEHDIVMLGDAEDYVQADSAFFDTHYHLREAGRAIRTERSIKDLCASGRVHCCRP